jgi:FKBP-type peptidyl-prolyl cis-trans isomerase FkpA
MSATAVPIRPLSRGSVFKLWVGLILLVAAAAGLAWLGTRGVQRETTATGLQYQVIQQGEGEPIAAADLVRLQYVGRVERTNRVFDATMNGPAELDANSVIPGFGEALQLMRMGGRYRIWIPPSLGYAALGPVPPQAPFTAEDTLVFDVQIVDVARGAAAQRQLQQMQQLQQMMQQQGGAEGAGGNGSAGAPPTPEGNSAR